MLAPVQDFVLDHPKPTFLEKQYLFKQHLLVFGAKKNYWCFTNKKDKKMISSALNWKLSGLSLLVPIYFIANTLVI